MTVQEADESYNIRILLLMRGELSIIPNHTLKIKKNDIVIVKTNKLVKEKTSK